MSEHFWPFLENINFDKYAKTSWMRLRWHFCKEDVYFIYFITNNRLLILNWRAEMSHLKISAEFAHPHKSIISSSLYFFSCDNQRIFFVKWMLCDNFFSLFLQVIVVTTVPCRVHSICFPLKIDINSTLDMVGWQSKMFLMKKMGLVGF